MKEINLKRVSKDEIIEIYNNSKNIKKCTKYLDILYYCIEPIIILHRRNGIQFSKLWFINKENELIYIPYKNDYVNLNKYDKNESYTKDIFVEDWGGR